jgi:spore coat protein A
LIKVKGPLWRSEIYPYENTQPAGALWYHDHALGITRLNVYAGMVGFYIMRDESDTGKPDNPLGLPAAPYEVALAMQDKMFKEDGSLFYPSFPGEPGYEDYIVGEGAVLPEDVFPNGGASALAEFFGDFMVVNGKIWPKMEVEPRNYRLRLLNGCDSRYMFVQFVQVPEGETDLTNAGEPLPFYVIGKDQGLASSPTSMDTLLVSPGARADVVFDFGGLKYSRIIMKNVGPDEPYNGQNGDETPKNGPGYFETNRVMAFDVVKDFDASVEDNFDSSNISGDAGVEGSTSRTRKVALFEG